jgi:hypothetical protein
MRGCAVRGRDRRASLLVMPDLEMPEGYFTLRIQGQDGDGVISLDSDATEEVARTIMSPTMNWVDGAWLEGKLRAELVQVAAMCLRWILDLDDPDLPVYFTSPSGRVWREVARDVDGNATVQQYRCRYLSTAPNGWGCFDPRCGDSTWDHECPVAACTMASHLVLVEP